MPSSKRTLAINLLLAVASTVAFALVLEMAARARGIPPGSPLLPSRDNCLRRSTLLSMEFQPNCHGQLTFTEFDTNSLGLRSPEIRDDGSRRILAIGDSCTWGWGVPQDASYPAVLQRLLDERYGVGRYQVINAGMPGFTSYQGLLYLRERGLALRPSVVIFGYGFNDDFALGDVERQLAFERRFMPVILADEFLFARSSVYSWLRHKTSRAKDPNAPPRVDVTRFDRNLAEIVRVAREHGAPVLGLSFAATRYGPYADALGSVTSRLGVPLIDVDGPRLDLVHPTVEGYRMLAARILERLEEEGYVD